MKCSCPVGAFPTITDVTCSENFGQVQKALFCRISTFGTVVATPAGIIAALQAKIPASALVSPFLEAPSQEPGEARTFGGGNDTPNGVEVFLGMGPSTFSAAMRGVPQNIVADMKALICFAEINDLGVILVNGEGQVEGVGGGTAQAPTLAPIPVRALRISDKIHGGYEEPDRNEIEWQFLPDYSDGLTIVTPTTGSGLDLVNED